MQNNGPNLKKNPNGHYFTYFWGPGMTPMIFYSAPPIKPRKDLEQFFDGYELSGRLHLQTDPFGQPTGIGFVEFVSEEEAERAKAEMNMQHMGTRYIQLMDARDRDLAYLSPSEGRPMAGKVLRLQGLPFSVSTQDLQNFFAGYGLSGRSHIQTDGFWAAGKKLN